MSLALGFDLSTQQLKIVSCYQDLSLHSKYSIDFDEFKDIYGIHKGVLSNRDTGEVVTPVKLFVHALQTLLDRMHNDGFPFDCVTSISGSCQQHGTIFCTRQFDTLLSNLNPASDTWHSDLSNAFSYENASNWQDRSTGEELAVFEKALGSAEKLCKITGSKAHFRFSGPQMRRRAKEGGVHWEETAHISLISNFLDSILSGKVRGVEIGEACGTNLFDIEQNDWNDELLSLILMKNSNVDGVPLGEQQEASLKARQLLKSLVEPDDYSTIAPYLAKRYGFKRDCKVWPITGDNLATIMSLPLKHDDLLVSMGTSTTVLLLTKNYLPSVNYHLFKHPVVRDIYMGMLCYSNGALAREEIRDEINDKYKTVKWDKFNEILDTRKSPDREVGIYFPLGEIIPNVKPCKRIFKYSAAKGLVEVDREVELDDQVKLIIESQALSNRLRVAPLLTDVETVKEKSVTRDIESARKIVGDSVTIDHVAYTFADIIKRPNSVYYAGGSSQNASILKIYNDILGPKHGGYKVEVGDACALGGCFRAIYGYNDSISFQDWLESKFDFHRHTSPIERDETHAISTWASYLDKVAILTLAEQQLDC